MLTPRPPPVKVHKIPLLKEPEPNLKTQAQLGNWQTAIEYLKSFDFKSTPPDHILRAFANLAETQNPISEAYASLIPSHYFSHFAQLLECSESFDETQTWQVLEHIACIREFYLRPCSLFKSKNPISRAVNSLLRRSLLSFSDPRLDRFHSPSDEAPFVVLLELLFRKHLFSDSFDRLESVFPLLIEAGLARAVEYVAARATRSFLTEYIVTTFSGVWDRKIGPEVLKFIQDHVLERLSRTSVFFGKPASDSSEKQLMVLFEDAKSVAKNAILDLRTLELFSMVQAYPASAPALEEVRLCLSSAAQRASVAQSFSRDTLRKMLHPGTPTAKVICFYMSMIKSFLVIDPRGVLLDRVCRPTRRYLREQSDTMRYVVAGLLAEGEGPLSGLSMELEKAAVRREKAAEKAAIEDLSWCPDPIDALPDFQTGSGGDVVEAMTLLFEPKSYVGELVRHFSRQLLAVSDYDVDSVVEKVRLLRTKLTGELDILDVMVGDVVGSGTIDRFIRAQHGSELQNFKQTVILHLFWPKDLSRLAGLAPTSFKVPPEIEKQYKIYSSAFSQLKKGRVLEPVYSLGTVHLEVELEDRTLEFRVPPHVAAILGAIQEGSNTIYDLLSKLQMEEGAVEGAITYWVQQGILEREGEIIRVLEREEGVRDISGAKGIGAEREGEGDARAKMEGIFPFIQGMLTNLGGMDVARIKGFLGMVVPKELGFSCTDSELEEYLESLVEEDRLELERGLYKLR